MDKKELAEYVRLDIDHPGWKVMSQNELVTTYWMYFSERVAWVRVVAIVRRDVVKPLARIVNAASDALDSLTGRPKHLPPLPIPHIPRALTFRGDRGSHGYPMVRSAMGTWMEKLPEPTAEDMADYYARQRPAD
jgi:hypothetical protein